MSVSKPINREKIEKKYKILIDRLKEENPEIEKEEREFFREIEKTWKRISPFIGEEEAYAQLVLHLNDKLEIRGYPLSFILFFVLFKRMYNKLDRELKWLRENREILEMIVKEYLERQRFR